MPPTVPSARYRAYLKQQGRCFYCGFPMWLSDLEQFARANRISLRLAQRFKCTAEHLKARSDGGSNRSENIVAACIFCNARRHRRTYPLAPYDYRTLVERRVKKSRWHPVAARHLRQGDIGFPICVSGLQ